MSAQNGHQWDSVEQCLDWVNAQPDPKEELLGIISFNLDIDEKGFVLDLVTSYLGY